jgi:hypothetical protein
MSFRECIQTAIDTGRISSKKGAEAFRAYDRTFERSVAAGEPEGVADGIAAAKTLDEITTLKGARRWQRLNEMQRAHEIYSKFRDAKDPAKVLQDIISDMEYASETVRSLTMANLDRMMAEFKPKAGGFIVPERGLRDIVRAAYGQPASPAAKEMAEGVIEAREILRKWANSYGASIPENANAKLPQTHDRVKVQAVPEDEWVADHLRTLDWEVMRFAGREIDEGDREDLLRRTYQGIINDGFDRGDISQLHTPGLASRLNRDRFLYYKDADAYMDMQDKYGAGSFYDQTINMVEVMAKDISLLRVFGPHAESMKEFTKRAALSRAAELNNAAPAGKKDIVKRVEREAALFQREYDIHAWHVPSADGNFAVQTFSAIRTLAVSAKLGFSLIPNMMGDLANSGAMKNVLGVPQASVLRSYAAEWVPSPGKRREAARMGIIFENAISLTQARIRYFGALDGPAVARRVSDITYRLGLAAHHTQVIRNAQGKQVMGIFAEHANVKFDDLPFAPLLMERGITADEWDRFRATPLYVSGRATFLLPIDMWRAGDDASKKVAEKFSDVVQMYIRTAVPDTTLRSRAFLGEALDPNSVMTQSIRTMTSLWSFPAAIWFNQLERIAHAPGLRNKIVFGTKYFTWMLLAGAAIVQLRALANGDNLFDMRPQDDNGNVNLGFWGKALAQGGGLGIVGDLVFNNVNMSNSPRFSGDPTTEYLKKLHKLTIDNLWDAGANAAYERGYRDEPSDELNVGKDALDFMDANVPDLWYTKVIWERAIGDELMQQGDPAAWERKQRYHDENVPQGRWWELSGEPEAPRLETAVGG